MDYLRTAYRRIYCHMGKLCSCKQNIPDYFPGISFSYSYRPDTIASLGCLQTVDRSRLTDLRLLTNKSKGKMLGKVDTSPGSRESK